MKEDSARFEQPFVVMGVGKSGSGKTTILKPFTEQVGAHYLSSDAIREELSGNAADQSNNKIVWQELYARAQDHLMNGRSIVIDATHARPEERQQAVKTYRDFGAASIIALLFDSEIEVALANNKTRATEGGRDVPEHAIRRMHGQIRNTPPTEQEGFDSVVRAKT